MYIHIHPNSKGLVFLDPYAKKGVNYLTPAYATVTSQIDSTFNKVYNIEEYILSSRLEQEFLTIPYTDLPESSIYKIEVRFGEDSTIIHYLHAQDVQERIVSLAEQIELDLTSTKGIYRVTHNTMQSESNTTIIITASALLNAMFAAFELGDNLKALDILTKIKNTLQLWS